MDNGNHDDSLREAAVLGGREVVELVDAAEDGWHDLVLPISLALRCV